MDRSMPKRSWDTAGCSYAKSYFGLSRSKNPYTLCADASKYAWWAVLPQEHTSVIDDKM